MKPERQMTSAYQGGEQITINTKILERGEKNEKVC
jgi:hypothetical protein